MAFCKILILQTGYKDFCQAERAFIEFFRSLLECIEHCYPEVAIMVLELLPLPICKDQLNKVCNCNMAIREICACKFIKKALLGFVCSYS